MTGALIMACAAVLGVAWCMRMATQNRERIENLEERLLQREKPEEAKKKSSISQNISATKPGPVNFDEKKKYDPEKLRLGIIEELNED